MRKAESGSVLLEKAREHDRALRAIAKRETVDKAEAASRLLAMKEGELHRALGYASIYDYGKRVLGYSGGHVRDLIGLAERLRSLPKLEQAFRSGEIRWTNVREAARGAEVEPEKEAEWVERARALPNEEVARAAAKARGEPVRRKLVLELSEEEYADVEDAVRAVRRERREATSVAEAVATVCRRAFTSGGLGGVKNRITIGVCDECGRVTRQTSAGPVAMSQESFEQAACSSEVVDVTEGPSKKLQRKIPAHVLRYVIARDGDRCRFPGCPNRGFVEEHHEGGWRQVGHDATKIYMLCTQHHQDRHCGRILAAIEGTVLQFALADGTAVGEPIELDVKRRRERSRERRRDAQRSHERAPSVAEAPTQAEGSHPPTVEVALRPAERSGERTQLRADDEVLRTSRLAMRRLEFTDAEIRRRIDAALAFPRAEPWTVEALVLEALRATA